MSKAKELTEQAAELHKKQTEEMKALEEQREQALKEEKHDEAAQELHNMYNSLEQAWELTKTMFYNSTKKGIF